MSDGIGSIPPVAGSENILRTQTQQAPPMLENLDTALKSFNYDYRAIIDVNQANMNGNLSLSETMSLMMDKVIVTQYGLSMFQLRHSVLTETTGAIRRGITKSLEQQQ